MNVYLGFPGGSGGEGFTHNAGDLAFTPRLGRPPGGVHSKLTPGFSPGEAPWTEKPHGQRSRVGNSPQGNKESDTTELLSTAEMFI